MEYKIQERILVNQNIEEIRKKLEPLILDIKGKITLNQTDSILWVYKYAFQTIQCKINLVSDEENTEIVIMVDSDYIGLLGSKKIINDLKKALLDNEINYLKNINKDSEIPTEQNTEINNVPKSENKKNLHNSPQKPITEQNYIINEIQQKTDPFAIVTFAAGLGGFVILPILFIPVGYIASMLSYYRLKENKELKGSGLRIFGAILTTINILWLMYQFKLGIFRN
jgi:hypothetical protein